MTDQLNLNLPNAQPSTTVDGHQFEPIKGYPMLHWKGKRPFTSTQYYPAQLKEVHGAEVEGWRSKIYWGDNLQVRSHLLKEFRGKVDLVYIDPPFDSKADYKKIIKTRGLLAKSEISAFEEKQYTDIWTNDEYLQFLYERIILLRELLSNNGSIYVHCDEKKSHYIRLILEEVFGESCFLTEITWRKTSSHGDTKGYGNISEKIIFFSKSSEGLKWNAQYLPLDKYYVASEYRYKDEDGRRFRRGELTGPGVRSGDTGKPWRGINPSDINRHWGWIPKELDAMDLQGKIYWPPQGKWPHMKVYLDKSKGVPVSNIWTDIPMVNNVARERTGYPTQKPEKLLERIIYSSTEPGDLVFDCFMGSGTTQAVAMKLGRRFIGADINLGAVQITTKRLLGVAEELETQAQAAKVLQLPIPQAASKLRSIDGGKDAGLVDASRAAEEGGTYSIAEDEAEVNLEQRVEPTTYYTGFEVYNVNHYDVFRNPLEAKDLLLEALEVNRLTQGNLFDGEKDGRMVKIMPVNRIATRADLNELIAGFDYKAFEKRYQEHPHAPVEKITLVCMGHEPDLAAQLKREVKPFELDVEVVDILRDKQEIQFKRDSEASIVVQGSELVIEAFYPMNLLGKLSLQQENVEDWRELVESVMIDWNYDGAIFQPLQVDIPSKNELVSGRYPIPDDAGTIRIKITDLLSESLEVEVEQD